MYCMYIRYMYLYLCIYICRLFLVDQDLCSGWVYQVTATISPSPSPAHYFLQKIILTKLVLCYAHIRLSHTLCVNVRDTMRSRIIKILNNMYVYARTISRGILLFILAVDVCSIAYIECNKIYTVNVKFIIILQWNATVHSHGNLHDRPRYFSLVIQDDLLARMHIYVNTHIF